MLRSMLANKRSLSLKIFKCPFKNSPNLINANNGQYKRFQSFYGKQKIKPISKTELEQDGEEDAEIANLFQDILRDNNYHEDTIQNYNFKENTFFSDQFGSLLMDHHGSLMEDIGRLEGTFNDDNGADYESVTFTDAPEEHELQRQEQIDYLTGMFSEHMQAKKKRFVKSGELDTMAKTDTFWAKVSKTPSEPLAFPQIKIVNDEKNVALHPLTVIIEQFLPKECFEEGAFWETVKRQHAVKPFLTQSELNGLVVPPLTQSKTEKLNKKSIGSNGQPPEPNSSMSSLE